MINSKVNLSRLQYFVAIAETGSITAAATRMGVSKAVVSKQLALLEQEHSVCLMRRNSRGQSLTDIGEAFYVQAKKAVDFGHQAFDVLDATSDQLKGHIRIAAPVALSTSPLAKLLATFSEQHPELTIFLDAQDQKKSLVHDQFDLAIRAGWLEDSSNKANLLVEFQDILVASKNMAARIDPACVPRDLSDLPFIANSSLKNSQAWEFCDQDGAIQSVQFRANLAISSTLAIAEALKAGTAIAVLPDAMVQDDLEAGDLVRLAPEWHLRRVGVYAVTPPNQTRNAAVRVLVQFLKDGLNNAKS